MIINPNTITKIRITDKLPINHLLSMVKNCEDDYILIADSTYSLINSESFEINANDIVIPVIIPYNSTIDGPFGRPIKNISIESNLKVQPFSSQTNENYFIPYAFIANKDLIIQLLEKAEYSVFLELSLLCMNYHISLRLNSDWQISIALKQESEDIRSKLSVKYGTMRSLVVPCQDYIQRLYNLHNNKVFAINKFYKIFSGSSILLTDMISSDIDVLSFSNLIVSINHNVIADYYIALDEETLENVDNNKTISQISIPSVKRPFPIDAREYDVSAYFGIKQFSSDISFEPPFTRSTNKILTALEIICYFKPLSITVMSNSIIGSLIAVGDGPESVKKQIFMTKIIDYCLNNNIKLNVFGDLCNLN